MTTLTAATSAKLSIGKDVSNYDTDDLSQFVVEQNEPTILTESVPARYLSDPVHRDPCWIHWREILVGSSVERSRLDPVQRDPCWIHWGEILVDRKAKLPLPPHFPKLPLFICPRLGGHVNVCAEPTFNRFVPSC